MAAATDMDLRTAMARLAAAGLLVDAAEPGTAERAAAAVANQARDVATRFAGRPDQAGWPAVAFLTADRRRLACALALNEADYLTTLRDRCDHAIPTVPCAPDAAPVLRNRRAGTAATIGGLPLFHGADEPATLTGILVLNDGAAEHLALVSLAVETPKRLTMATVPWRIQAVCRPHRDGRLAASLVVGAHPAWAIAAALANTEGGHGWATAGALAGALPDRAVAVVAIGTTTVPAHAELVLHGHLSGSAAGSDAVFDIAEICHRDDPVMHWMDGPGLDIDAFNLHAAAVELTLARHLRDVEGGLDILDVRCYPETENQIAAIKLRPRFEGQSKTALMAALSSPELRPTLVIAVDEDIDLASLRDVAWSSASRLHGEIDIAKIADIAVAVPDGTPAPALGLGTKWFIDSTMPPLTQPQRRAAFDRATPKNLDRVNLADFLPD